MHTYCRLKNGEIMIIWSDNSEVETMNLYPLSKKDTFNVEFDTTIKFPYSEIEKVYNELPDAKTS